MRMKRNILLAALLSAAVFASCEQERQTYIGPSLIMFSDTLTTVPVQSSDEVLSIDVAATYAADYDRTVGVEVVQKESNAVEGRHFTVESYSVTIPAGQQAATFDFRGIYDNMDLDDSLVVSLRLVSPENDEIGEGSATKVRLQKVVPFSLDNFTRYAVVTSDFLRTFLGSLNGQRLVFTEPDDTEPNTVRVMDAFSDGYDIRLTFDASDPLEPALSLAEEGMPAGDVREFAGAPYGDNLIRLASYPSYESVFDTGDRTAEFYAKFYVENVGYLVNPYFLTSIQWISDAEAEDILKNGF